MARGPRDTEEPGKSALHQQALPSVATNGKEGHQGQPIARLDISAKTNNRVEPGKVKVKLNDTSAHDYQITTTGFKTGHHTWQWKI